MDLEGELNAFLDRSPSQRSLEEFHHVLTQATEIIEGKLHPIAGVNNHDDEDLARLLQQQLNMEEDRRRQEEAEEAEQLLLQFLKQDNTCELCHAEYERTPPSANERSMIRVLSNCEHRICRNCASAEIVARRQPQKQSEYICPISLCGVQITEADVRALLTDADVERFIDLALNDLGCNLIKCPAGCGWAVTVEVSTLTSSQLQQPQQQGELGIDGKPLSDEARRHRDQFRIRCRRCHDTDFCAECLTTPYHLGFTCAAHAHFQAQRHCRFCGAEVPKDAPWIVDPAATAKRGATATAKQLAAVLAARHADVKPKSKLDALQKAILESEPLANLCASPECQQWAAKGCNRVLPCRHVCIGVRDEPRCIGCLQCPTPGPTVAAAPQPAAAAGAAGAAAVAAAGAAGAAAPAGPRGDDLCNICWVDELRGAPCVLLDCGHVFHQHCLERKVAQRWCGARITFSFLDCPLCKAQLSAPALAAAVAPYLELKAAVLGKAEQRLALEGGHKDAQELQPGGRYHGQPAQYALHKFAYYLCSKCQQPYFGGHRSCEVAAGEGEERAFDASEMVCGGCSALGKTACARHGVEAIEYKCKFCCAVASWFCWGTTHFCDSCHRKQGTAESMSKKARNQLPTCTPQTCPLKVAHPPNGEEFVLGCQICRSATSV